MCWKRCRRINLPVQKNPVPVTLLYELGCKSKSKFGEMKQKFGLITVLFETCHTQGDRLQ